MPRVVSKSDLYASNLDWNHKLQSHHVQNDLEYRNTSFIYLREKLKFNADCAITEPEVARASWITQSSLIYKGHGHGGEQIRNNQLKDRGRNPVKKWVWRSGRQKKKKKESWKTIDRRNKVRTEDCNCNGPDTEQ